jgi:topoisomerase-4 subunit B
MDDSNDLFGSLQKPASRPERVDDPLPRAARSARPQKDASEGYSAADIEVLEGLEPVRRRPGMYIGGTDEKALHHLFAEVIDNSMDEAVAGHATFIEVELDAEGFLTVTDNGRGIPVDPHPKFKDKSALEVIMCTLHAGGKFDSKVYETSGGLHGVGVSVVNALSDDLEVEVARGRKLYRQRFARGVPQGPLENLGEVHNRRGTRTRFHPDPDIFGRNAKFEPARLFRMARSKADGCLPLSRRPEGLSCRTAQRRLPGHARGIRRQERETGRPRLARMGGHLVRRRRLPELLLQHHPDARGRHA